MSSPPLAALTIGALRARYAANDINPSHVIDEVLGRIAAEGDDWVWISRVPEAMLRERAQTLDLAQREGGTASLPLFGVPFAVKDNIDVAGLPTTAACPDFAYLPDRSAAAVRRLEAAGAIVIGKTNLDQFATGLVGVRSPYGVPRNPFDADYHSRRIELRLGGRGRDRIGRLCARHRHGRLGPRAGRLQQSRRA